MNKPIDVDNVSIASSSSWSSISWKQEETKAEQEEEHDPLYPPRRIDDGDNLELQILDDQEDVDRSYPNISDRFARRRLMRRSNTLHQDSKANVRNSLEEQEDEILHSSAAMSASFRLGNNRNTQIIRNHRRRRARRPRKTVVSPSNATIPSVEYVGNSKHGNKNNKSIDDSSMTPIGVKSKTILRHRNPRQLSLPGAQFIPGIQLPAITENFQGEESEHFRDEEEDSQRLLTRPGATNIHGIGAQEQLVREEQGDSSQQDDTTVLLHASRVHEGGHNGELMGTVVYDAQKMDRRIPLWALISSGLLVILTLTLAISLPLTVGRRKVFVGTTSPMPSLAPSMPPSTTREMIVTNYIRDVFSTVTSSKNTTATDIVDDPKIQRAIEWMALEDLLHLDPMLHDNFLQRFLLALFYFQTGPWRTCNPNFADDTIDNDDNNSTTCTFDDFQRQADSSVIFVPLEDQTRWLSSAHECDWVGITCLFENRTRRVHFIELTAFGASGTLPTELVLMPSLYLLSLNYNNFVGTIPLEYATGWKQPFQRLDLNGNFLTGTIPQELLNVTSIKHLNLGQNMLTGTIDSAIGQLSHLTNFDVFDNGFDGTIPTEIGKLDKLASLHWNSNYFDGTIPSDVAKLESLAEIWLSNNTLTGTIPETWATRKLTDLRLGRNRLDGTIPNDIFLQSKLQRLDVSGNGFSGRIDSRLTSLSELQQLRLSQNRFTGTIPRGLGELSDVTLMWFHENKLTGTMPSEICDNTGPGRIRFLSTDCRSVDDDRNQTKAAVDCRAGNQTKVAVKCGKLCCSRCCIPPTYTPDGFVDKARSDCADNYICAPIAELNECLEYEGTENIKKCLGQLAN